MSRLSADRQLESPTPIPVLSPRRPARRRGGLLAGLRRLVLGFLALFLAISLALYFGRNLLDGLLMRLDAQRSVHPDESVVDVGVRPEVRDYVTLVYRSRDGTPVRVLAEADAFSAFVRERVETLETARATLEASLPARVDRGLDPVFTDMHGRVERFADWYFAWSTGYRLMLKAVTGAVEHALTPGVMSVSDGVSADLSRYIESRYAELVLRPELTDAQLRRALDTVLAEVHGAYLNDVAALDEALQRFIATQTTHLQPRLATTAAQVTFDWDSQRHKLSVAGYETGELDVLAGLGLTAGGALAGKGVGAAAAKGVSGLAAKGLTAKLAAPYVAKAATAAAAAGIGAVGGPTGALLGGAAGLGIDYAINESAELAQRPGFEAQVGEAVDATRSEWRERMVAALTQAVHAWYGDSVQLLVRFHED